MLSCGIFSNPIESETYLEKENICLRMTQSERIKEAKEFVKAYLEEYRHRISRQDGHRKPAFYENYPYNITVYQFPNETLGISFVPSDKGRIKRITADFDDVRDEIMESERFLGFFPFEDMSPEAARERAGRDAETDILFIEGGIGGATARLQILKEKIEELVKLNPWLDEEGAFQQGLLDEVEKAIEGLTGQDDREFELLRLRAFRERPSEIEVKVSGLDLLDKIREDISSTGIPEENRAELDELKTRIGDVEERLTRVGKLLPRIRDQINDLDEKIDAVRKEGMGGRSDKKLSEIRGRLNDLEARIEEFEKEDLEVPEQIKNTVFRMNQRVYNLDKRVKTIEEYLKRLSEKKRKAPDTGTERKRSTQKKSR